LKLKNILTNNAKIAENERMTTTLQKIQILHQILHSAHFEKFFVNSLQQLPQFSEILKNQNSFLQQLVCRGEMKKF
jgi:hypothetical protein